MHRRRQKQSATQRPKATREDETAITTKAGKASCLGGDLWRSNSSGRPIAEDFVNLFYTFRWGTVGTLAYVGIHKAGCAGLSDVVVGNGILLDF
jgi:hypothetical protein